MKKTLLITGFDPFGGETINPAWEAVRLLPDQVGNYEVCKLQVPTVFGAAARTALARGEALGPDVILCVGQAGGRRAVTPERVAINLMDASIADNAGVTPKDQPIAPEGPAAYFATVPVKAMTASIREAGIEAAVSNTAGTFVCNSLLYSLLHHYTGTGVRAGFIHVPYLPQQAKEGVPSMALDDIVKALTAAIGALD